MAKKIKFNYANLKPCDIMICGGKGVAAYTVRANTIGWKYRHNLKASTHTAIVIELHGRLVLAESKGGQGLKISSLKDYNGSNKKRFCLGFRRISLTGEQRKIIQESIAQDIVNILDYDKSGALSFNKFFRKVFKVKQNPALPYCSEYARDKYKLVHIVFKTGRISPYFIQYMKIGALVKNWIKR